VAPDSQTETFAAVKLQLIIGAGLACRFYLRAGKRLAKRTTEIQHSI